MITKYPIQFYGFVLGLITLTGVTIGNNSLEVLPILIALLVAVHVQAILLTPILAVTISFITISTWILTRSQFGIWTDTYYLQSLLEISLLGLNTLLAIQFRRYWHQQKEDSNTLEDIHSSLSIGQASNGLLSNKLGKLRLIEEVGRASLFRRPVAIILLEATPKWDDIPESTHRAVSQAVIRRLSTLITAHDIPYYVKENTIALIMPERGWDRLYEEADNIEQSLQNTSLNYYSDIHGVISDYLNLRFGLSVYESPTQTVDSLLELAEKSLAQHQSLVEAVSDYDTVNRIHSPVAQEAK